MENLHLLQPKEMLEQIAHLTSENQRLKAEKNQIHEEKKTIQSQLSHLQNQNTDLQQQIEKLQTEKYQIEEELYSKIEESVAESRKLRRERDKLLEEREEREQRFDSVAEDSTQIVLSLLVAQTDLEERMERTKSVAEGGRKKRSLFVMKDAADFLRRLVRRQGSGRRV